MRILSWNIQWGRGIDGKVDLARTAAVAREFDADVLCLQEVAVNHPDLPGGAAMDQAEWLAGLFLGRESAYGIGSDLPDGLGGRRQFGNLILSRRPILQVFRHRLPWPADPAVPGMQRVAVEAVIEAPEYPGGALRVITTHLEYYSALQRTAQIEALRAICDEGWGHAVAPCSNAESDPPFAVLPRGEGCVLCGDFNSPAGSPEHAPLRRSGEAPAFVDAWEIVHPAVPPAPTFVPASRSQGEHEPSRKPELPLSGLPVDRAPTFVPASRSQGEHEPSRKPEPPLSGLPVDRAPTFGVHDRRYITEPACYDLFWVSENIADRVMDVVVDLATEASDHQPLVLDIT